MNVSYDRFVHESGCISEYIKWVIKNKKDLRSQDTLFDFLERRRYLFDYYHWCYKKMMGNELEQPEKRRKYTSDDKCVSEKEEYNPFEEEEEEEEKEEEETEGEEEEEKTKEERCREFDNNLEEIVERKGRVGKIISDHFEYRCLRCYQVKICSNIISQNRFYKLNGKHETICKECHNEYDRLYLKDYLKKCEGCGQDKLCSYQREKSDFVKKPNVFLKSTFSRLCKQCTLNRTKIVRAQFVSK